MFEKSARMKLRFTYKGQVTVEDLWDLSAEELDSIYRGLRTKQKEASEESLLTPATGDKALNLKVDIVRHVFGIKLQEKETKLERSKRLLQRRRIAEILAQKQDQNLLNRSEEELRQLLSEMEIEEG